jgi:hypothetical protein
VAVQVHQKQGFSFWNKKVGGVAVLSFGYPKQKPALKKREGR